MSSVPPPTQDPEPSATTKYDGTSEGGISILSTTTTDISASDAHMQLFSAYWTGFWPLLHITIANPQQLTSNLIHLTVDLLGSVSIVDIFLLTWFFDLTELTDAQWDMIMSGSKWGTNVLLFGLASKAFQFALISFMVVDASFVPAIFAMAVASGVLAAVSMYLISQSILEITDGDYGWAFLPYLVLLYWAVSSLWRSKSSAFRNDKQAKATDLFYFATEYTGFAKGTKAPI